MYTSKKQKSCDLLVVCIHAKTEIAQQILCSPQLEIKCIFWNY